MKKYRKIKFAHKLTFTQASESNDVEYLVAKFPIHLGHGMWVFRGTPVNPFVTELAPLRQVWTTAPFTCTALVHDTEKLVEWLGDIDLYPDLRPDEILYNDSGEPINNNLDQIDEKGNENDN
jgi:hypothetical protein